MHHDYASFKGQLYVDPRCGSNAAGRTVTVGCRPGEYSYGSRALPSAQVLCFDAHRLQIGTQHLDYQGRYIPESTRSHSLQGSWHEEDGSHLLNVPNYVCCRVSNQNWQSELYPENPSVFVWSLYIRTPFRARKTVQASYCRKGHSDS